MTSFKVLICDDDAEALSNMVEILRSMIEFEIVLVTQSGEEAVNYINNHQVDILVLDILMPKLDGFEIMQKIDMRVKEELKILALTPIGNDNYLENIYRYGANYIMVKPIDISVFAKRMKDIAKQIVHTAPFNYATKSIHNHEKFDNRMQANYAINKYKHFSIDEKLANIFISVGIPAHIKGYQFLREAIKLTINNPDIINSITKKLYPSIAGIYDTSASKVERAIRHAIEVAWNRGKIENINDLFGIKVYSSQDKPTNGEFIALVADKMLTESAS